MSAPLTEQEMARREGKWLDEKQRLEALREAHAALRHAEEENRRLRSARDCAADEVTVLERFREADRLLLERCRQIVRWADSVSPGESSTGGLLRDLDARLGRDGRGAVAPHRACREEAVSAERMRPIEVGDSLAAVWGPEGVNGGHVGRAGVEFITVIQLPGPMGHYLAAVLCWSGKNGHRSGESVIPLHMASEIVRGEP